MSFPRAAIKRFNEPADATIPPPGTYDPKFVTDVGVSSSAKTLEKSGRGTGGKARPEGNELFQVGRLSRNLSWTSRKRSMTSTEELSESERKEHGTSHSKASLSKSRLSRPISITNSRLARASRTLVGPSVTSIVPLKALQTKEQGESSLAASDQCSKPTPEITEVFKYTDKGIPCHGFIQEIQDMAQNIQVEVSEYKRRLTDEIIRSTEQEEKKLELEFTIQSLKRKLAKYNSAKETWKRQEIFYDRKLEEFTSTKLKMENELRDLQVECKGLKETELKLKEKLAKMENDKSVLEGEKRENEKALQLLQQTLKEEESRRESIEKKHKEVLSQMTTECKDSPVEVGESDTQVITDMYEVRLRELTQQREALNKELDAMRQELQEGKALLELAEFHVGCPSGMDHNQNYIS